MGRKSREKWEKRKINAYDGATMPKLHQDLPWTPFEEAHIDGVDTKNYLIFRNSRYQVWVRKIKAREGWQEMIHLSIKRNDRQTIHDWRDLQRIKNELVGSQNEAVELYPAESRLTDTANQYHLWVLADPNIQFPFGFDEGRLVSDNSVDGSVQRPFPEDAKPADLNAVDIKTLSTQYKSKQGLNVSKS